MLGKVKLAFNITFLNFLSYFKLYRRAGIGYFIGVYYTENIKFCKPFICFKIPSVLSIDVNDMHLLQLRSRVFNCEVFEV
jgi:hypothetical protein